MCFHLLCNPKLPQNLLPKLLFTKNLIERAERILNQVVYCCTPFYLFPSSSEKVNHIFPLNSPCVLHVCISNVIYVNFYNRYIEKLLDLVRERVCALMQVGMHQPKEGCNNVIEIELEFLIDGFYNKDYFQRGFEFKCNKNETLFEILPI